MSMVQQLLTDHIDTWTAAETEKKSGRGRGAANAGSVYGIRKLRELILELAVRGKLVPQDAADEPASELLKRIQAEKSKLIADGKLKKGKALAEIAEDEKPFELPKNWEWVRLGQIGDWGAGATPLRSVSSYYGGETPWFKSGELTSDFIDTSEETITKLALKDCSLRLNHPGDVLIAMYGATIGKTAILKVSGTTNQAVCACTPNTGIFNRYLLVLLKATKSNFIGQGAGGAQPNISREKIISTVVAIPPTAEQQRIVAKVDELMALCDQLENQHSNAAAAHETLVSYLLGTLTQSQSAEEFSANWQRIAAHFDTLFTTDASIAALKQTLLQLAVMGKLVPQDANDEPASELLKRIQAEKSRLVAEGKIKKDKPLPPITDDEKPFDLPKNWLWVRLQDVIDVRDGTHDSPKESNEPDASPLVTSKDFLNGDINFDTARKISAADHLDISKRSLVEKYDILFSMIGGNIGNQVMVNDDRPFSVKNVALFKYYDRSLTIPFFIKKYTENLAVNLQSTAIGGAQPFVALGALRNLLIALPPLAEQHRIVAKVDELMALCDQLKSRITDASRLQQKLADVLVEQAVA